MNMKEHEQCRVTAADLVRHFGLWQERATTQPIFVTRHGRDSFVLQSACSYQAMQSRTVAHAAPAGIDEQALIDQLSEGFVAFDAELAVIGINPAACAMLRLGRAAAIGMRPFATNAGPCSLFSRQLAHSLRSGMFGAFDTPSPAFADRWLSVRTFPHRDGVGCLLRDVTDGVADRRREDQADAIVRASASHGAIGRAWLTPRGTFAHVDATLAAMVGLSAEAMTGARLIDILPVRRRHEAGQALDAVLSRHEAVDPPDGRAFTTALLRNDGGEHPVRIALAALCDDRGRAGAVMLATAA